MTSDYSLFARAILFYCPMLPRVMFKCPKSLGLHRIKRDEARKFVAAGISPSVERQEEKAFKSAENANTFEKIAALYLAK